MTPALSSRGLIAWAGLALLAAMLFIRQLGLAWPATDADPFAWILLTEGLLPRGGVAVVAGAALGLSGMLLQRCLRNPVADPSTLGVAAGAQLALGAATLFAPSLLFDGGELVAFLGGASALGLVLLLAARRDFDPVTVVLSGLVVSLVAGSVSATLILFGGDYLWGLFLWGGGALDQDGWRFCLGLVGRIALAGLAVAALFKPFVLLGLDDGRARGLGLSPGKVRLLILAVAVLLATSVTAALGIIGFIGLAAPNMARLAGARTPKAQLLAAPAIGAVILLLTDQLVMLGAEAGLPIPTGAATALVGGPMLLWLLPRLQSRATPPLQGVAKRARRPRRLLAGLCLLGVVFFAGALLLGQGESGWTIATGAAFDLVAPFRLPRMIAGAAAGAMLGVAGLVMQRVTANPIASPEVLGVSSGAGLGLALVLLANPLADAALQFAGTLVGAAVAVVVILGYAAAEKFGPERLLLGGVAIGAFAGAGVTAVMARGGPEADRLLTWMSGSTLRITSADATAAVLAAALLCTPLFFLTRWLVLLPLGGPVSQGLGLSARRAGSGLVLIAAALSAAASLVVGPLSFVGLLAPHLARLIGLTGPRHQLAGAMLLGMLLMLVTDFLARTLAFPYQLPLGLFASMIGGPYLVWLLNRRG